MKRLPILAACIGELAAEERSVLTFSASISQGVHGANAFNDGAFKTKMEYYDVSPIGGLHMALFFDGKIISSFAHTSRIAADGTTPVGITGANLTTGSDVLTSWSNSPCTDQFYDTGF